MSNAIDVKTINEAIRAKRIPHSVFKEALDKSKALFHLIDDGMPGSGIIVHGDSGVGKTTLADLLVKYGQHKFGADSVIKVQLTSGATIKSLISQLLHHFGDRHSKRGETYQLEARLKETISSRGCRLIIVDEVQHLIPGGHAPQRTIENILNAFKMLDDTNVSFVLAGMDSILLLWNSDEQIRSRFHTTFHLERLSYPKDKKAWRGIVKKYTDEIEHHGMTIDCENLADRLYIASQGAMRPLVLILTTAVTLASKEGSSRITTVHLHQAAEKQIDKHDGIPNAFAIDLKDVQRFSRFNLTDTKLAPVNRGLGEIFST